MKLKTILLGTALAAAFAGTADAAASNRGWYVGVEAGANWIQDVNDNVSFAGGPAFTTVNVSFDTGWAAIATVGYAFWESNWRLEVEGAFRDNDQDNIVFAGGGGTPIDVGGSLEQASLMANALYDIPLTSKLTFSIGAGAGVANTHLKVSTFGIDDRDWSFAWQGIAGLSYAITDRIDLTLNYRYFRVEDADYQFAFGLLNNSFDPIENHTVTIGLRFDLTPDEEPMAAEPPRQPPPAPMSEPHEFIIFFGFNKSNLTPEAHHVLEEAAAAAKQYGTASILITGHTDTVGSNRYNMKLSMRRANAARAGLVSEGISPSMISVTGKGETELLVQTGDGVKEPQNRRAAIDLQ